MKWRAPLLLLLSSIVSGLLSCLVTSCSLYGPISAFSPVKNMFAAKVVNSCCFCCCCCRLWGFRQNRWQSLFCCGLREIFALHVVVKAEANAASRPARSTRLDTSRDLPPSRYIDPLRTLCEPVKGGVQEPVQDTVVRRCVG